MQNHIWAKIQRKLQLVAIESENLQLLKTRNLTHIWGRFRHIILHIIV